MVKALSFFKRRAGMSVEAFQAYWQASHPEVVVKLPGIRPYVQSHTLLSGYRKGEPVHDRHRDCGMLAPLSPCSYRRISENKCVQVSKTSSKGVSPPKKLAHRGVRRFRD